MNDKTSASAATPLTGPTSTLAANRLPENTRAVITALSPKAAKLLAAEILLADPESLGDDVLESCLYLLRDRLTEQ